jgi:hypothetical protein
MSNGGIEGPAGMTRVNDEARTITDGAPGRPTSVVEKLLRGDLAIRELLMEEVPGLSASFLDAAQRFEEHTSGQRVIAALRGLMAGGLRAGEPPELVLRIAPGDEYSLEAGADRIVVFVPAEHACQDDPPPE